jgi:anti-anti-sigma factor
MVSTFTIGQVKAGKFNNISSCTEGSTNSLIISLGMENSTDSRCIFTLPPTFSLVEAIEFEQRIEACFAAKLKFATLVLDFSQTWFIDSTGLGSLVICHRTCKQHGVAMVLSNVPEQVQMLIKLTGTESLFDFEGHSTLTSAGTPKQAMTAIMPTHPSVLARGKRIMDVVGGLVGLVITASLTVPIALAIKLEDGGPIFFQQVRCSWMGQHFHIWKFRSMVMNAEVLKDQVENQVEGALFKNENDPRITKVGRFLRRTSLDELPQFWNVLKGEMSLVGTRPPTPDEVEKYKIPEWQRLNVKPGMTGEWQVNGRSTVKSFDDVVRMDLSYQANWSLWYDFQLILKTILVLFSKRSGAA